jgi:hypothetical protein
VTITATAFRDVPGLVGLLDEQRRPLGQPQPCIFSWEAGPQSWRVEFGTAHQFDLLDLPAPASYIAVYGQDADDLMFTLPVVGRAEVT